MGLYAMKELLRDAQARRYGIGFFNAVNMEMTRAYIAAAEETNSPIILGTAEGLLPCASFEWIVPLMLEHARAAKVPVAVHLDHAYSFDVLIQGLRAGFGSIMYDGSREKTAAENVRKSAEIVKIAHSACVDVECELGSVGGLEDGEGHADAVIYTEPEEAAAFLEQTGADFLAVSIGTAHGVYHSAPKLDIPRLEKIRAAVDAPLVLHGGSGLSDDDFRNTIAGGICKINIYTDIILAARDAIRENTGAIYTDMMRRAEDAMKAAAIRKLELFGSAGKS